MLSEKNTDIEKKEEWKQPNIQVGASLPPELWKFAKENSIGWSSAMELGIQILGADSTLCDYPECKLVDKMNDYKEMSEKLSQELEALQSEAKKDDTNNP